MAADELAEVAFKVQGEVAGGVGDARGRGPELVLRFAEGFNLLAEFGDIADKESGDFL